MSVVLRLKKQPFEKATFLFSSVTQHNVLCLFLFRYKVKFTHCHALTLCH